MRVRPRRPLPPKQALAASIFLLVFATLLAVFMVRRDAVLRDADNLRPAKGEVVSYRERVLKADRLRVRFPGPEGDTVTVSMRVDSGARYEPGQPVDLLYDPESPGRARTADNWSPGSPVGPVVLVGGGLLMFGTSVYRVMHSSSR